MSEGGRWERGGGRERSRRETARKMGERERRGKVGKGEEVG